MSAQEGDVATTMGRAAAFYGPGTPMEIKAYRVPDPEPGAAVVKTTLANVCGSDLHQWRGEFDVAKFGRAGRYLEIGNISPGLTYTLDPQWLVGHNRSILGMVYYEAEHLQQALDLVMRTRDTYPWDRVLSHKLPLERINEAFEQSDQGKVTRAAIVL